MAGEDACDVDNGGFAFPKLPAPKQLVPLTATSTVTHAAPAVLDTMSTATHVTVSEDGTSTSGSDSDVKQQEPQSAVAGTRKKVPLEKGYSQMSWMRLTKTIDLTDGHGVRENITMEEVGRHNKKDDAWVALHGKVYNMTHYLNYHPGGVSILMKAAGKDATSLFMKYHPWVNARALLEKALLGTLAPEDPLTKYLPK